MRYLCDEFRHLICEPYSVENLHRMAADLGIKRCWYHAGKKPHYDIPKRRIAEITAKCTVVSSEEIVWVIRNAQLGLDNLPEAHKSEWYCEICSVMVYPIDGQLARCVHCGKRKRDRA